MCARKKVVSITSLVVLITVFGRNVFIKEHSQDVWAIRERERESEIASKQASAETRQTY